MTVANPADQLPAEALLPWLMRCHRNLYLAAPGVPPAEILPPWAKAVGMEEFEIDYEPRCLAVISEGPRVVVGTKAGSVYLAIWNDTENRWRMERCWQSRPQEQTQPRAIRAVAMLDDTTLVAGWGAGNFRVLKLGPSAQDERPDHEPRDLSAGLEADPRWLRRFSRLVRLHPHNQVPAEGDLVLGLSIGARVHLLSRHEGRYEAVSGRPQHIPFLQWKPHWGRLVDATWSHRRLWFLSSRGVIIQYRRENRGDGRGPLIPEEEFQLRYQRRGGSFRALSGCVMGLSVLASDHVTFLRFQFDEAEPRMNDSPPRIDPAGAHWFSEPDAIDCTVCLPYDQRSKSPPTPEGYIRDPNNPVWTVVTTEKNELHWIAWPDFPRDSTGQWLPWRAPAHFTSVGKGGLYARFGWPASGRPPFLAIGTRDHKLRIVSVLDRIACEETIQDLIEQRSGGSSISGFPNVPGAELWSLSQQIESDFRLLHLPDQKEWDRTKQLLSGTSEDNLRTLVVTLLRAWKKEAPQYDPEQRQTAKAIVSDWMLRLLQRAYEFGPDLARQLARSAYERIAARRGDEGDGVERWNDLGHFANFLRKWVLRGYTYEEKPAHLRQLYEWNRDCGRHLDALAYLTRLFRRRVDPEWKVGLSEGGSSPAVWDLAACPSGDSPESLFAVASFTDGSLSVFSRSGHRLPWRMAPSLPIDALRSASLDIDPQGEWLRHKNAEDFLKQYRHGPYARSILLIRQNVQDRHDQDSYLLFFPLRGWRSQDRTDQEIRKPRVYALLIRPELKENEAHAMLIEGVTSEPIDEELYGLCALDAPGRTAGSHLILAGTSGTVKDEQGRWIACPFREIEVKTSAGYVKIVVHPSLVDLVPKGQRSLFRNNAAASEDAAYNPCWVLVSLDTDLGPRVWGGFQDGYIRGFQGRISTEGGVNADHPGRPHTWVEGGWTVDKDGQQKPSGTPRQKGLKVSAAVWSLHLIEREEDQRMLAYGTGDGTIGMIDLEVVEGDENQEFCHLLHTRESSPICALMSYDEDAGKRLLSVTQQGIICIFSLDRGHDFEKWAEPAEQGTKHLSHRFLFPGLRLDHFSLRHSARAMVRMDNSAQYQGEGPTLLVGSVEGEIHKHHLRYPRKSSRREVAREELDALMPASHGDMEPSASGTAKELAQCVGTEHGLAWLRMLDLNDLNLVKFSLWRELHNLNPAAHHPPDPLQIEKYVARLRDLANEVYSRRPFSSEPAKVLWEVTGRFANQILREALRNPSLKFGSCLDAHRELAIAIDDLCNRWIGFHQSFEAKVLVHSFDALFDWTHIVLLAGNHGATARVFSLRKFLLHKIVQRRLYHSDSTVALETLRILNAAMLRAIAHAREQKNGRGHVWDFGLRLPVSPPSEPVVGFYDLMAMVGDLGERLHESLVPASPFSTEIIRFFALSLLLVPNSALIIGQVVSESRMTEYGEGLARAIGNQAKRIATQLRIGHDRNLDRAIQRFDAYCSVETKLDLVRQWPDPNKPIETKEPWLFLLQEALRSGKGKGSKPSDEEFLGELKNILVAASWLSWLDAGEPLEAVAEALEYLEKPDDEWTYFKHSVAYLKGLRRTRDEVRALAGLEGSSPSIVEAISRCERELREIRHADLFQPQRTHYEEVIRAWHKYLVQRGDSAVQVLDIMDEFNRHVYRTSADNLMTSITELAMQASPFFYDEEPGQQHWKALHKGPVRRLLHARLEGNPLIREVFERGDRLVDYTHLSGTLLEVARDYLGMHSDLLRPQIEHRVTGDEVWGEIERERVSRGLIEPPGSEKPWNVSGSLSDMRILGTRATWNAIVQEFAINISRYCHDLSDRGRRSATPPYLKWAILEDGEPCVLISGSVAFLDSLPDKKKDELRGAQGQVEIEKLKDLILSLWKPRVKAHDEFMRNSSGMGLHLIKEISRLSGLRPELILFDPREKLSTFAQRSDEEKMKWPLCLKVSEEKE